MVLPMPETEIQHGFSFGISENASCPRGIGVIGKNVIQESDEFPTAIVGHHFFNQVVDVMPVHVGPGLFNQGAGNLHPEALHGVVDIVESEGHEREIDQILVLVEEDAGRRQGEVCTTGNIWLGIRSQTGFQEHVRYRAGTWQVKQRVGPINFNTRSMRAPPMHP